VTGSALILSLDAAFAFVALHPAATFKAAVIMLLSLWFDCIKARDQLIKLRQIETEQMSVERFSC
jgi:hypothetical protein